MSPPVVRQVPTSRTWCTTGVRAATFDDTDAWKVYDEGAEHQRVRTELIVPDVAERGVIQFSYDA